MSVQQNFSYFDVGWSVLFDRNASLINANYINIRIAYIQNPKAVKLKKSEIG